MFFKGLSLFLQALIDIVAASLKLLVSLFPPSPFTFISTIGAGELMANINYFVPIYEFVTIIEAWLVAIALYYIYSMWARFLKVVQ